MMDWKGLVGRRVLVRPYDTYRTLLEDVVEEVSPSGNYVKLRMAGWANKDYFVLEEVLDEVGGDGVKVWKCSCGINECVVRGHSKPICCVLSGTRDVKFKEL